MLNDTDQYQNTYTLNSALRIVIKGLFRKLPNFIIFTFICSFFAEKLWKVKYLLFHLALILKEYYLHIKIF